MRHHWIYYNIWRAAKEPAANVPFGVRSIGHYRLKPPFTCNIAIRPFLQLFWCLNGSGIIVINGIEYNLKAGQVAVYWPDMLHKWFTHRQIWEFRWITLDGPLVESIAAAFGLQPKVYDVGPAPTPLFRKIEQALRHPSKPSEARACSIAFQILSQASFHHREEADPLVAEAIRHIHQRWSSSQFNITALANDLRVHRSILSRRFHQVTGLSPINYMTRVRLQNVFIQLQNTRHPMKEIARLCGYTNPAYASRLVRQVSGVSPQQFRLTHQRPPQHLHPLLLRVSSKQPAGPLPPGKIRRPKSEMPTASSLSPAWADCK